MGLHYHHFKEKGLFRAWLMTKKLGRDILRAEISWRSRLCLFGIGFDEETGTIGFTWAVPYLFLSFGVFWPRKWIPRGKFHGDINIVYLSISQWSLRWEFWHDSMGWSSDTSKWRHGSFNAADFLLGKPAYSTEIIEQRDVLVPMPEKSYEGKAELFESTWKRPRWFAKKMLRVSIDIPEGIPHAGKGTSSWNCGDDATFGLTTSECRSIPDGVGQLVGSCLSTRVKHGGWSDWKWHREDAA